MTLSTVQSFHDTQGQIYMTFTITDARHSNPIVAWGTSFFTLPANYVCYPVVRSFGQIRSLMTVDGSPTEATISIDLHPLAQFVPSNGTKLWTVADFLREINMKDVAIGIYQYNAYDTANQTQIWGGQWVAIEDYTINGKNGTKLSVRLSPTEKSLENPVSSLVTAIDFTSSPPLSRGQMISVAYGTTRIGFNGVGIYHDPAFFNFPVHGVPGIPIKEDIADVKQTVRFANNDGTTASLVIDTGATDNLTDTNSFWIYDQDLNAYGMIDALSVTNVVNNATAVEADIDFSPIVHLGIVPSTVGALNTIAGLYKLYDQDPNNYVDTSAGTTVAFDIPSVPVRGVCLAIRFGIVVENVHATKTRKLNFGIWNKDQTAGASWVNGKTFTTTLPASSGKQILYMSSAQSYVATDCAGGAMLGNATVNDFAAGRFYSQDAAENPSPLQMAIVSIDQGGINAGTDSVRIYGFTMVVKVRYENIRKPGVYASGEGRKRGLNIVAPHTPIASKIDLNGMGTHQLSGVQFLAMGDWQKDDVSGTYTGSASQLITNIVDVLHHLLRKRYGATVNTTSNNLGSFVDHRSGTSELFNISVNGQLGPEPQTFDDAKKYFQSKFPVKIFKENNVYQLVGDERNPQASRFYRSTSNPIEIQGYEIIDFHMSELDFSQIKNNYTVQYHKSDRDGRSLYAYNFQHPVSSKWFGLKREIVIDEPWINAGSIGSGSHPTSVQAYGKWLGCRFARPRAQFIVTLPQKYYDLRRGHILQFSRTMETYGFESVMFRGGLFDYVLVDTAGVITDYADSNSGKFVSTGANITYFGAQQVIPDITANLSVAGAYTGNAVWSYSANDDNLVNYATQPTNRDGFKSTGKQTIGIVNPTIGTIKKSFMTLYGTLYGPCYWSAVTFNTPTVQGTANDYTSHTPCLWGRLFEVVEVNRNPGRSGRDYPHVEVVLQETM